MQTLWIAVDAQTKMPVGVAVANEEPTIRSAALHRAADDGRDHFIQDLIRGRCASVKFGIEPCRAGRKRARYRWSRRQRWRPTHPSTFIFDFPIVLPYFLASLSCCLLISLVHQW